MKREKTLMNLAILLIALCMAGVTCAATMGTAFTYQGRLMDANSPAEGEYDMEFKLFDQEGGSNQFGNTVIKDEVDVIDGYFTVQLDFVNDANVFDGNARWLEIGVREGQFEDPNVYVALSPRQELTPAPYALALPGLWTRQNATSTNIIGGYSGNSVMDGVVGATISGGGALGEENEVTDDHGTVGGGKSNQAGDNDENTSDARWATVSGGENNVAIGKWATIGGGGDNVASYQYSTVGGGKGNTISGGDSTIGGGTGNTVNAWYATIGGGWYNTASDPFATVGGGYENTASYDYATVGGGQLNTVSGWAATIPGGQFNEASGNSSLAAGMKAKANHDGAFVWADSTNADFASTANHQFLIRAAGGVGIGTNSPGAMLTVNGAILRDGSTMYGTNAHTHINLGTSSTTGALSPEFNREYNTVSGGYDNHAEHSYTTVSGGQSNMSLGTGATVPGGRDNTAGGTYSFAAGQRAKANGNGTFVWADSTAADFASTANDQFLIRASGGVGIGTTSPDEALDVDGAVKVGTTANTNAGAIRWNGTDFEGYDGSQWISLTSSGTGVGSIVQVVNYQTGAVNTGSTQMPFDDTIPQNTEGDEYMTLAVTPTDATNKLRIDIVAHASNIFGGIDMTAALFKDSDTNALAAGQSNLTTAGKMQAINFTHVMTAGTTSEVTFKVRVGANNIATTTFNGTGGNRMLGDTLASSITITEIAGS